MSLAREPSPASLAWRGSRTRTARRTRPELENGPAAGGVTGSSGSSATAGAGEGCAGASCAWSAASASTTLRAPTTAPQLPPLVAVVPRVSIASPASAPRRAQSGPGPGRARCPPPPPGASARRRPHHGSGIRQEPARAARRALEQRVCRRHRARHSARARGPARVESIARLESGSAERTMRTEPTRECAPVSARPVGGMVGIRLPTLTTRELTDYRAEPPAPALTLGHALANDLFLPQCGRRGARYVVTDEPNFTSTQP